jgi:cell shape-determining protein MreD
MQQSFLSRLVPFLMLGVAIVAFFFGMLIMAYIFVFGALVGMALFAIAWIRMRFFPANKGLVKRGRTYDHED